MKNLETIAEFLKKHNIAYSSTVGCIFGTEMGITGLVVTHLDKIIVFTDAFADRVHMKCNGPDDKVTVRVVEAIDCIKSLFGLNKPASEPDLEALIKRLDAIEKRLDDMDRRAPTLDDYRLLEKRLDVIEKSLDHMGKRITDVTLLAMCTGGSK